MNATSADAHLTASPAEALLRQEIANIAAQLEGVTLGRVAWRAADASGTYGMEFTYDDGPNPSHQCQQWMDANKARCERDGYTLQRVRLLSTEERLLAMIANQLRGLLRVPIANPETPAHPVHPVHPACAATETTHG